MLKTKRFRRLLTVLLAVLMLSVSIPAAAFAAGDEKSATTTRVTFLFSDNETFSESVLGSGIYTIGETYTAEDITAAVPEYFELDLADGWTFTVETENPTIMVPVKRQAQKTEVAFLFTDNATFSKTVTSDRIYEIGGTFTGADISVPLPEGFELADPNFTFTVETSEPTITVPVKREALKTEVAFLFTDNATFSQTVISDRIYEIGGTFTTDDISVDIPEGWELDVPADWTFTVETSEPTITVPVKVATEKTEVAFLFTDNATFSKTVISERIYEIGGTYTAADISVAVPEYFELDVPADWTFTVETSEPTIMVPVKREAPKTEVAFLFTDNATFSQTVISDRIYEIGGTFTADDISVDIPEGWELDVPADWTFTVETSEPTITVPVKVATQKTAVAFLFTDNATFSKTVISDAIYEIGGEFAAEDISVDIPEGWELDTPEEWTFKVTTAEPTIMVPVKAAATESPDPEQPTTPPTEGGNTTTDNNSGNNNTTTVTSNSNDKKDSGEEVVKSTAAPADNTAKVLPQTGVQASAPIAAFVVVLAAALAGAACYLFVVRKKLN